MAENKSTITSSGESGKPEHPGGTVTRDDAPSGWGPPLRGEAPYNKASTGHK